MNVATTRFRTGIAAGLQRLSGWACLWLVLPLVAASGQEADGRRQPAVPPLDKILATLRPEHPRGLATSRTLEAVRASVRGEGLPARIYAEVKKSADQTLAASVSKYEQAPWTAREAACRIAAADRQINNCRTGPR